MIIHEVKVIPAMDVIIKQHNDSFQRNINNLTMRILNIMSVNLAVVAIIIQLNRIT